MVMYSDPRLVRLGRNSMSMQAGFAFKVVWYFLQSSFVSNI